MRSTRQRFALRVISNTFGRPEVTWDMECYRLTIRLSGRQLGLGGRPRGMPHLASLVQCAGRLMLRPELPQNASAVVHGLPSPIRSPKRRADADSAVPEEPPSTGHDVIARSVCDPTSHQLTARVWVVLWPRHGYRSSRQLADPSRTERTCSARMRLTNACSTPWLTTPAAHSKPVGIVQLLVHSERSDDLGNRADIAFVVLE
jgi:hypothetical protein